MRMCVRKSFQQSVLNNAMHQQTNKLVKNIKTITKQARVQVSNLNIEIANNNTMRFHMYHWFNI